MKALVLDGSRKIGSTSENLNKSLTERLKAMNWDVKMVFLPDMSIAPCTGCFGCWIKTPGVCVIDDEGRDVPRWASDSDLWIFITNVTFGGYSSELKKAVDRMICLGLPFFKKVKDEIHHPVRYAKCAAFLGIGLIDSCDSDGPEVFKRLIERNAILPTILENLLDCKWI